MCPTRNLGAKYCPPAYPLLQKKKKTLKRHKTKNSRSTVADFKFCKEIPEWAETHCVNIVKNYYTSFCHLILSFHWELGCLPQIQPVSLMVDTDSRRRAILVATLPIMLLTPSVGWFLILCTGIRISLWEPN